MRVGIVSFSGLEKRWDAEFYLGSQTLDIQRIKRARARLKAAQATLNNARRDAHESRDRVRDFERRGVVRLFR